MDRNTLQQKLYDFMTSDFQTAAFMTSREIRNMIYNMDDEKILSALSYYENKKGV